MARLGGRGWFEAAVLARKSALALAMQLLALHPASDSRTQAGSAGRCATPESEDVVTDGCVAGERAASAPRKGNSKPAALQPRAALLCSFKFGRVLFGRAEPEAIAVGMC